jgi:hypothetical protein
MTMLEQTFKVIFIYFGLIFLAIMFVGFLITVVHVYKEFFSELFKRKKGKGEDGEC